MPNPWDVGSARYLQHLGFPALATTSAGFAFSQGLPDADAVVGRGRSLSHIAEIAAAVDLPVNADFASGYGADPQGVAESVKRCVATGVAGLSIEDATGDPSAPLYELPLAALGVRRISVGPALALAAWTGFVRAAQALRSDGSFAGLAGLTPYADINDFLATELQTRGM